MVTVRVLPAHLITTSFFTKPFDAINSVHITTLQHDQETAAGFLGPFLFHINYFRKFLVFKLVQ